MTQTTPRGQQNIGTIIHWKINLERFIELWFYFWIVLFNIHLNSELALMNGGEPLIVLHLHLSRVEPVPHSCACAEQQQQAGSTTYRTSTH